MWLEAERNAKIQKKVVVHLEPPNPTPSNPQCPKPMIPTEQRPARPLAGTGRSLGAKVRRKEAQVVVSRAKTALTLTSHGPSTMVVSFTLAT